MFLYAKNSFSGASLQQDYAKRLGECPANMFSPISHHHPRLYIWPIVTGKDEKSELCPQIDHFGDGTAVVIVAYCWQIIKSAHAMPKKIWYSNSMWPTTPRWTQWLCVRCWCEWTGKMKVLERKFMLNVKRSVFQNVKKIDTQTTQCRRPLRLWLRSNI